MLTKQDIQIGTILKFRNQTDSYKYFRILDVMDKELESNSSSRDKYYPNHLTNNPYDDNDIRTIFYRRNEMSSDYDWHYIIVSDTRFEMAKEMSGPWVTADHTCELIDWSMNCDIFIMPQEKVNRLELID